MLVSHSCTPSEVISPVYISCMSSSWMLNGNKRHVCKRSQQDEFYIQRPLGHWDLLLCDQLARPASPTKCAWQHSFEIPLHNSPCDSPGSGGWVWVRRVSEKLSTIAKLNNAINDLLNDLKYAESVVVDTPTCVYYEYDYLSLWRVIMHPWVSIAAGYCCQQKVQRRRADGFVLSTTWFSVH